MILFFQIEDFCFDQAFYGVVQFASRRGEYLYPIVMIRIVRCTDYDAGVGR